MLFEIKMIVVSNAGCRVTEENSATATMSQCWMCLNEKWTNIKDNYMNKLFNFKM